MTKTNLVERLRSGPRLVSATRTISEGEFCLFHDLFWFTAEAHTSQTYMKSTQFGERILSGPIILGLLEGLLYYGNYSDWLRELSQDNIRPVAMLGWEDINLKQPVKPGDTLRCEAEISEVRGTNNPKRAVIKFKEKGFNQNNQIIAEITRAILFQSLG